MLDLLGRFTVAVDGDTVRERAADQGDRQEPRLRHVHLRPDGALAPDHGVAPLAAELGDAESPRGLRQRDLRGVPRGLRAEPLEIASSTRLLRRTSRLARPPRIDPDLRVLPAHRAVPSGATEP